MRSAELALFSYFFFYQLFAAVATFRNALPGVILTNRRSKPSVKQALSPEQDRRGDAQAEIRPAARPVARFVGRWSQHRKVAGSIRVRTHTWVSGSIRAGCAREATGGCSASLPLLPSSLSKVNKKDPL